MTRIISISNDKRIALFLRQNPLRQGSAIAPIMASRLTIDRYYRIILPQRLIANPLITIPFQWTTG